MARSLRFVAMLLLALLLPLQGYAAACAQICAVAGHGKAAAGHDMREAAEIENHAHHDGMHGHQTPAHEDCDESSLGAGKCCQAHVFVIDQPHPVLSQEAPGLVRTFFVARWTSFIPEEPSPPPIGASPIA
jgi:hypothetical protein